MTRTYTEKNWQMCENVETEKIFLYVGFTYIYLSCNNKYSELLAEFHLQIS
jgi:hypothetical protein